MGKVIEQVAEDIFEVLMNEDNNSIEIPDNIEKQIAENSLKALLSTQGENDNSDTDIEDELEIKFKEFREAFEKYKNDLEETSNDLTWLGKVK